MGEAQRVITYTYEQYLELEQETGLRHEFYFGEVFAMAGGSLAHNLLCNRLNAMALDQMPSGCLSFSSDLKLQVVPRGKYYYPDVIVTCHPQDVEDLSKAQISHPVLVAEVLSDSTEGYDRTDKFLAYTQIPGLKYYLLIAQDQYRVEVFARQAHDFWSYKRYSQPHDKVDLEEIGLRFSLEQLYERVTFPQKEEKSDEQAG